MWSFKTIPKFFRLMRQCKSQYRWDFREFTSKWEKREMVFLWRHPPNSIRCGEMHVINYFSFPKDRIDLINHNIIRCLFLWMISFRQVVSTPPSSSSNSPIRVSNLRLSTETIPVHSSENPCELHPKTNQSKVSVPSSPTDLGAMDLADSPVRTRGAEASKSSEVEAGLIDRSQTHDTGTNSIDLFLITLLSMQALSS